MQNEAQAPEIRPEIAGVHALSAVNTDGIAGCSAGISTEHGIRDVPGQPSITTRRARGLHVALEATSAAAMRAALPPEAVLTLPEIVQLTRRLHDLDEPVARLRIGIVHTYTSETLNPYLQFEASLQGLDADLYHAPYGVTLQETEDGSGLRTRQPDLTLLLLRWEDLHPSMANPLGSLSDQNRSALAADLTTAAVRLTKAFRNAVAGHIVLTLLPPMAGPGLGLYDPCAPNSEAAWRGSVKTALSNRLASEIASATFLDLDELVAEMGRRHCFDARWWYTARFPFTPEAARELARRVIAVGTVLKRARAKVIALDADNTLWGGGVGEEGITGIALGPDYPGNVYVAFQRRLLDYQQRGFLLAMCSKNNLADILEVLRQHPHQVLREEHFAAMRVNWESKSANLRSMAEELNLGIDSFIFVDDSDHECLAIRQSLPDVEIIQVPSRPLEIPGCLDHVARLEILILTAEDRRRTEMYGQERQRHQMAEAATDVAGYLRSLGMRMRVALDESRQVPRIAQLTQKTNQFNLTTRRYTEAEIRGFVDAPDWLVAHFSLTDIFGDSGVVGVILARQTASSEAEIDTLLMSCRVIGRRAESAFLETVLAALRHRGVRTVTADFVPSAKNQLAAQFLPDHGFLRQDNGRYTRDLNSPAPVASRDLPIDVTVEGLELTKNVREPA
jgi:FkbH-like protein